MKNLIQKVFIDIVVITIPVVKLIFWEAICVRKMRRSNVNCAPDKLDIACQEALILH